jgi:hypothetical protein
MHNSIWHSRTIRIAVTERLAGPEDENSGPYAGPMDVMADRSRGDARGEVCLSAGCLSRHNGTANNQLQLIPRYVAVQLRS